MNLVELMRGRSRHLVVSLLAAGLACTTASANDGLYPSRPIKFIVPYAPSGTSDLIACVYAAQLGRPLGQTVAVAEPNGYALMLGANQVIINAVFGTEPPLDPVNGFAPVGLVAEVPFALAVDARSPVHSAKELLALMDRKREFPVAHAQFDAQLELPMATTVLGIPYQGGAQALTAVLSGEVAAVMPGMPAFAAQAKAGKLRDVGIASSKCISAFPDRPTFVEQGAGICDLVLDERSGA